MNVTFSPTPYGTVHVQAVVLATEAAKAKRSIASQVGRRGLGKRLSIREHTFGRYVRIGAIYRKGDQS